MLYCGMILEKNTNNRLKQARFTRKHSELMVPQNTSLINLLAAVWSPWVSEDVCISEQYLPTLAACIWVFEPYLHGCSVQVIGMTTKYTCKHLHWAVYNTDRARWFQWNTVGSHKQPFCSLLSHPYKWVMLCACIITTARSLPAVNIKLA